MSLVLRCHNSAPTIVIPYSIIQTILGRNVATFRGDDATTIGCSYYLVAAHAQLRMRGHNIADNPGEKIALKIK